MPHIFIRFLIFRGPDLALRLKKFVLAALSSICGLTVYSLDFVSHLVVEPSDTRSYYEITQTIDDLSDAIK